VDLRLAVTLACAVCAGVACSSDGIDAGLPPDPDDPSVPSRFKESSEQPAWSPDGSVIVFTYDARTPDEVELGASQLWLYSLATKEVRYLTEGHFASWSPSGETLVYTLGSALWTINVASGEKQPLSSFDLTFQPRWSPTSQTILFVRWAPSQGLWAIEADGSNLRELGIGSFSADWAPEGTSFVCTSPSPEGHSPRNPSRYAHREHPFPL
jgi:Tol biopolymer transport system component